jgi:hypothetical protein
LLAAALIPGAVHRLKVEQTDLRHEHIRTHEIALLQTTINVLGGVQHIRNCGEPVSRVTYVSALAWFVHMNVGSVGHKPGFELHQSYPIVLFTPLVHGGWKVLPWHTHPWQIARCRGLNAQYAVTRGHPGGVLIRG